MILIDDLNIIR